MQFPTRPGELDGSEPMPLTEELTRLLMLNGSEDGRLLMLTTEDPMLLLTRDGDQDT